MKRFALGLLLPFVWGCDGAEHASDGPGASADVEVSDVSVTADGARLEVVPEQLEFGAVAVGEEKLLRVVLRNTGDLPLQVSGFVLSGSSELSLLRDGVGGDTADTWVSSTETAAGITFTTSISIDAGELVDVFRVIFKPAPGGAATAELHFISDAAVHGVGHIVSRWPTHPPPASR